MKTLVAIAIVLFYALVLLDGTNCIVVITRPMIPPQRRVIRGHFQQPQQRPSPVRMAGRARQARGLPTDGLHPSGDSYHTGVPIPIAPYVPELAPVTTDLLIDAGDKGGVAAKTVTHDAIDNGQVLGDDTARVLAGYILEQSKNTQDVTLKVVGALSPGAHYGYHKRRAV